MFVEDVKKARGLLMKQKTRCTMKGKGGLNMSLTKRYGMSRNRSLGFQSRKVERLWEINF
jgi:hypothetical protein